MRNQYDNNIYRHENIQFTNSNKDHYNSVGNIIYNNPKMQTLNSRNNILIQDCKSLGKVYSQNNDDKTDL